MKLRARELRALRFEVAVHRVERPVFLDEFVSVPFEVAADQDLVGRDDLPLEDDELGLEALDVEAG